MGVMGRYPQPFGYIVYMQKRNIFQLMYISKFRHVKSFPRLLHTSNDMSLQEAWMRAFHDLNQPHKIPL